MKTILRTVVILAAAVLVTYAGIALLGGSGTGGQIGERGGRGGFVAGQTPPDGAQGGFRGGGPRGGGEGFGGGRDGGEFDEGGFFGLTTIARNLVLISLI